MKGDEKMLLGPFVDISSQGLKMFMEYSKLLLVPEIAL